MPKETKKRRVMYFKDVKVYIKWRLDQESFNIEIKDVLNNPSYLYKFEKAMLAENERRLENYKKNGIENVTAEERSKGGTTAGNNNVKSGHWESLKTKEHQSYAGKKGGDKNVENGNWDKTIKAGHEWHSKNPHVRIENGAKMNKWRKENPDEEKKIQTDLANRIFIFSNGHIIKNGFAKHKYLSRNPEITLIDTITTTDPRYNKLKKQLESNFINKIKEVLGKLEEVFKPSEFSKIIKEQGLSDVKYWNYCKDISGLVERVSRTKYKKI